MHELTSQPQNLTTSKPHNLKTSYQLYKMMSNRVEEKKINDTVDRLVNPLDNAIHEKCARIKQVFSGLMDQYQASYYTIASHNVRHVDGTNHLWFERKKVIRLPRDLVVMD